MASKFLLQALTLTILIVFSTIVSGEDSSITLPLEDGETFHSILPIRGETANPYRLAVIGDSVAWGNGLNQEHKCYNLVAKWLRTNLGKPVEIIVYAHSGAVISGASGESVKDANLNSGYPSLMDQVKNVPNNIDLILVSGGINDVGIPNILDPKTSEDTIKSRSEDIQEPMKELLMYLVDNTKPDAKIIVHGYYPLITDSSKLGWKDRAAGALLARGSEESVSQALTNLAAGEANPTLGSAVSTWQSAKEFGINLENIIENDPLFKGNSYTFYGTSSDSLRAAVNDANKAIGRNRVTFVDPLFQSNNGYRASDSYLWEFKPGISIESNDEQYDERSKLTNPLDYENKDNALGHPNIKGASRYADFINHTLKSKISDWFLNAIATKEPTATAVDSLSVGTQQKTAIEQPINRQLPSGASIVQLATGPLSDGRPQSWAVDANGMLWTCWMERLNDDSSWTGWYRAPLPSGVYVSQSEAIPLSDGRGRIWIKDTNGKLWLQQKLNSNSHASWTDWIEIYSLPQFRGSSSVDIKQPVNGQLPSGASIVQSATGPLSDGRPQSWAVDANGMLWTCWMERLNDDSSWTGWYRAPLPSGIYVSQAEAIPLSDRR